LKVLHEPPGTIFVAEKADNGKREIAIVRASPLKRFPLKRIPKV
jgi:hypothetical protein